MAGLVAVETPRLSVHYVHSEIIYEFRFSPCFIRDSLDSVLSFFFLNPPVLSLLYNFFSVQQRCSLAVQNFYFSRSLHAARFSIIMLLNLPVRLSVVIRRATADFWQFKIFSYASPRQCRVIFPLLLSPHRDRRSTVNCIVKIAHRTLARPHRTGVCRIAGRWSEISNSSGYPDARRGWLRVRAQTFTRRTRIYDFVAGAIHRATDAVSERVAPY